MIFLRKIASEIGATAYVEFQASVAENKSFAKVVVRKVRRIHFSYDKTLLPLFFKLVLTLPRA